MPYPPHHEVRLLVCGGRDFLDQGLFDLRMAQVDALHWVKTVVRDGEAGAGAMAGRWALDKRRGLLTPKETDRSGYMHLPWPARIAWDLKPDLVLVFPGNERAAHTLRVLGDAGVTVWVA